MRKNRILGTMAAAAFLLVSNANAQDSTKQDEVKKELEELREKISDMEKESSIIRFGVSVGYRAIISGMLDIDEDAIRDGAISPTDSTLILEDKDRGSIVISAVVMGFPFMMFKKDAGRLSPWYSNIGVIVNVDLAEFSKGKTDYAFNKGVEGGLGLAYSLHKNFAIGITYETIVSRRLRNKFLAMEGKQIQQNGKVITDLNPVDQNFFIDDAINAVSFKAVFSY